MPCARPGGGRVQGPSAERKGAGVPLAGLPCATGGRSPLSRAGITRSSAGRGGTRLCPAAFPCRCPLPTKLTTRLGTSTGTGLHGPGPLCPTKSGLAEAAISDCAIRRDAARSGDPKTIFSWPPCLKWQTGLLAPGCSALQHHPFRHRYHGLKGRQVLRLSLPPARSTGDLAGRPASRGRGGPSVTPLGQGPPAPGALPAPRAGSM
jgi:hypothetical protein